MADALSVVAETQLHELFSSKLRITLHALIFTQKQMQRAPYIQM